MATAPVLTGDWVTQEIQQSNPQADAAQQVKQEALSIRVTDEATQAHAVDFAKRIKAKAKEIADYWKPLKDAAHKAHRALTAREGELLKPLSEAEAHLKAEVAKYHAEQQRITREAQRRAEEEARRIAEEEREALLEQLEAERASAAEVAAVAAAPLAVAPVPIVTAPPKVEGMSMRETWKGEVVDKLRLVQYVAGNPSMLHLLEPNQSAIDALAKAMKSAGSIPGVRFYAETRAALR